MFFPIKRLEFERIKSEYMMKKIEQMMEIQAIENQFNYYSQFFEPEITIRLGPDELQYIAETSIFNLDTPQPHFIQIVVGQKPEFKDFIEVSEKGRELIMEKLTLLYPNQFQ